MVSIIGVQMVGFNPGIAVGEIITNSDICRIFKCSTQGGMRPSKNTNTLVLTSDPLKPIYQDEWQGAVLHYTGMGLKGNQRLDHQNKTLFESNTNGIDVFLFEKLTKNKYLFQGQVELVDKPYQAEQPDIDGKSRSVWIFPIKVVDQREPYPLPETSWLVREEQNQKEAHQLTDEELKERATSKHDIPVVRTVVTKRRVRNPYVAEYVKRKANGTCQLCGQPAPFKDKQGQPYLIAHYVESLSKGGCDSIENAVALCPNCHEKMHVLDRAEDKRKLLKQIKDHQL